MSKQINEIRVSDFIPQSWTRALHAVLAPGLNGVMDNLDEIQEMAVQAKNLAYLPTRQPDRQTMMALSRRILDDVQRLRDPDASLRTKRFSAHMIKNHIADLQKFVEAFTSDPKAMKLMKQKADRDMVKRAVKIAKGEKPFPQTFGPYATRNRDMEDSTTDPNRPRSESFSAFLKREMLTEEKYMCRNGHLHNSQDRATNCATCKRQERKRAEKAAAK